MKKLIHPAFKLAIEEAKESNHNFRIGVVIFKGKRIISSAHNSVRSNKVPYSFKTWTESLHGECHAIIKAKRNLKSYSMLVIRLNNKNGLMMAKPCRLCEEFIKFSGIREVYFSNETGDIERMKC